MKDKLIHLVYTSTAILLSVLLPSCLSEYHFGKNDQAKIKTFSIQNQIGTINIDHDDLTITAKVDEASDINNLQVLTLEVSSFATVSPTQGDIIDFSDPVAFTVTAEDGTKHVYMAEVKLSVPEIQLNNSNFQNWYEATGSKTYYEPGSSKDETIWGTGNPGVVTLGSPNVVPAYDGDNAYALLQTVELPLGKLLGQGIGAGSMFTGFFKLNLSNPIASAKFGVPYSARPKSFSIKYKYKPGVIVKDGKLNELPNAKDSCDIGIIITDRSAEPYKQVAIAWYRTGGNVSDWNTINLDFKYGLIASPANYERPKDVYILDNGEERLIPVVFGTGDEKPTHITVVFASSHRGDFFEGAPGSELAIDDLELIY
ncbi:MULTISPECIES: PCMD domain-containing protein [unclassified Carboxylicivirga]|uniref:PCMD domain-containing protein n=1 Tax=Carboxylicivirga TaxID=1628153 RepID=UPI003D33D211